MTSRAISAISSLIFAALFAVPVLAQQGAGYVANLSGPLFAVKADGSRRILSMQSTVEAGDTLVTEEKTYARIKFSDSGEVTLRPKSQFQIVAYRFDTQAPERDSAAYRLVKGALRTVTGLIGKRGSEDAYRMSTSTATIGIRGTIFGVTVCVPGSCGDLAPGTYVNVIEGRVAVAPPLPVVPIVPVPGVPPLPTVQPPVPPPGAPPAAPPAAPPPSAPAPAAPVILSAGQFGFVPPSGPPAVLPGDPGVGRMYAPPAGFVQRRDAPPPGQQPPAQLAQKTSAAAAASGDCEVR